MPTKNKKCILFLIHDNLLLLSNWVYNYIIKIESQLLFRSFLLSYRLFFIMYVVFFDGEVILYVVLFSYKQFFKIILINYIIDHYYNLLLSKQNFI